MPGSFDPIDSVFDLEALKKEAAEIEQLIKTTITSGKQVALAIKAAGENTQPKGTKAQIEGMQQLTLTTADYTKTLALISGKVEQLTTAQKKQLQSLNDIYKQEQAQREGAKATVALINTEIAQEAKLATGRTELAKTIALNTAQLKAEKLERDRVAKVLNAENNSLEKSQAIIDLLINKKKKLNLETEQGRRVNEAFNKAIERENEFILKNSDAETKRIKNIGNYQGSAKIIVDALEKGKVQLQNLTTQYTSFQSNVANKRSIVAGFGGNRDTAEVKKYEAEITKTEKEMASLQKRIDETRIVVEGFNRVTSSDKFFKAASKIGDAKAELQFFTKELIRMEMEGQKDTPVFREIQKRLAELKDQIGDTKDEIAALASDTEGFDLFAGAVTFAADAMSVGASAAVLFGASEDDAAAATAALTAIQNISNGVKGIANELTTKGTAANKAFAFVQGLVATALDKSAAASKRLMAALGLLGIIVTIVGAIVVALAAMRRELTESEKSAAALKEVIDASASAFAEATTQVEAMRTRIELAKKGLLDKKGVLLEYNKTIGDTTGQVKSLDEAEQALVKNADSYIQMLFLKAQVTAALKLASEEIEKALKAQVKTGDELLDKTDKTKGVFKTRYFGIGFGLLPGDKAELKKSLTEIAEVKKDAEITDAKEASTRFINIYKNTQKELAELTNKTGFKADGGLFDKQKKEEEDAKKALADRLKQQIENDKRMQAAQDKSYIESRNRIIQINAAILADENATYAQRLKALQENEQAKKDIALREALAAKRGEQEVEKLKIITKAKTVDELIAIDAEYSNKRLAIEQETNAAIKELYNKSYEDIKTATDAVLATDIELAAARRDKAVKAANAQYLQQGIKGQDDYEKAIRSIEDQYAVESIQAEIRTLQEKYIAALIYGENTLELERRFNELSLQLSNKLRDGYVQAYEDINKAADKSLGEQSLQKEIAINKELLKVLQDFNAGKIKDVEQYQKKVDDLNARAQENQLKAEIDALSKRIASVKRFGADTLELEKQRSDKEVELNQLTANKNIAIRQKEKEAVAAGIDLGKSLLESITQRRLDQIGQLIQLNEDAKNAEIERITQTTASEEEKAARIAVINARAQAEKEALEKKQRRIEAERARFQRGIDVAEIIANTIKGAAKAGFFSREGIAQLIIGGIQLTKLLATPLPKFKHGLFHDYEGDAIVDDGGRKEAIVREDGTIEIAPGPVAPRITRIKKGDRVLPDAAMLFDYMKAHAFAGIRSAASMAVPPDRSSLVIAEMLQAQLTGFSSKDIVKAINNKKELHLSSSRAGLAAMWKHGAYITQFVKDQTNWGNG